MNAYFTSFPFMHNLNMYIFPIEFLSIDYLPRYWLSNFTISFTNFALKYTVYIYIYSFIAGYFQYCDGTEEQKNIADQSFTGSEFPKLET